MPFDDLKERTKALDIAVGQIEKQFGKGSIMRLGQHGAIAAVGGIQLGVCSGRAGRRDRRFPAARTVLRGKRVTS